MNKIKEHLNQEIIYGKTLNYSVVCSDKGYCFYEKDASMDTLQYFNEIKTNIIDVEKLCELYDVVKGDADVLNQELAEKMQAEMEAENLNQ